MCGKTLEECLAKDPQPAARQMQVLVGLVEMRWAMTGL
jgi:hypothetical protein